MRSIEIDVRFEGGRVRVKQATGVTDRRTANDIRTMVRLLWRQPTHRALVLDLARPTEDPRHRKLFDVYAAYLSGRLADLSPTFEDRDLEPLRDEWLAEFQASDSHKQRVRQCFTQLLRGMRRSVKLSDLPFLLEEYRTRCIRDNHPRAFNYAKQASLALLRDKVGKRHPLRAAVADVPGMPEAKNGVMGFTVAEARERRAKLVDAGHADAAAIWWAMCCTGMGSTELWGEWTTETRTLSDGTAVPVVRIMGTKRPGRRWGTVGRDVPLVCPISRPTMTRDHFAKLLRKAGASPYQGRKSFANWLEDGEVMRTVRRMLLGHGAKDVTDRYEKREITQLLGDVRARLLRVLGPETALQLLRTQGMVMGPLAQEA